MCAIRLNFLSSIFSANFKSRVMNHWAVYFYLHSLMLLFRVPKFDGISVSGFANQDRFIGHPKK